MGRLRYIEPELWDNPDLRRLGFVARDVFVYLFARAADDEGRFRWEPFAILEATFSRNDPVTEDSVTSALDGLGEAGMLLRYGDRGEFGFLTGWFAHQAMDGRWRRGSNLPRPPADVGSWAEADEARVAYSKALGKTGRNVSYRESLRWLREQDVIVSVESPENLARISRGEGEGEGDVTPPPHLQKTKAVDVNVAVNGYLTSGGGGETANGYDPAQVPDWDKIAWELSMIGLRKGSRRCGQPSIDGMRSAIKKGKLTEDEIWEALCACKARTDVRNPVGFILQRLEDGFVDREST